MSHRFIPRRWRNRYYLVLLLLFGAVSLPEYVSAYTVSGPSEAPTLLLGDHVIVNRAAYELKLPYSTIRLIRLSEPRRGELVLFFVPNRNTSGLKQVVAIAGDRVEMIENRLIINGRPAEYMSLPRPDFETIPAVHGLGSKVMLEQGAEGEARKITFTPGQSSLRSFGPIEVPRECVFLLGDHRDNSNDSRTFGPIGRDLIGGKVVRILRGDQR